MHEGGESSGTSGVRGGLDTWRGTRGGTALPAPPASWALGCQHAGYVLGLLQGVVREVAALSTGVGCGGVQCWGTRGQAVL